MTQAEILSKLAATEITVEEASDLLNSVKSKGKGNIYFRVSRKGGISAYGLQRMPVTLYVEQWERVLGAKGDCSSEFAVKFWDFVEEWDGKEFSGKTKDEHGKEIAYKAKITRKAA